MIHGAGGTPAVRKTMIMFMLLSPLGERLGEGVMQETASR